MDSFVIYGVSELVALVNLFMRQSRGSLIYVPTGHGCIDDI